MSKPSDCPECAGPTMVGSGGRSFCISGNCQWHEPHPPLPPIFTAVIAGSLYRHKRGGKYQVLAVGRMESDYNKVVTYQGEDGAIWVRALSEFEDGRFVMLEAARAE